MLRPGLLLRLPRASAQPPLGRPTRRAVFSAQPAAAALSPTTNTTQGQTKRRLDVAVVGLPNAGKSQLLNVLTQSTVSAVSRKRHTTRQGILGARTLADENCQLLFVDTPGFLKTHQAKREGLPRNLSVTASSEMLKVDFSLLVVDAARALTSEYKETIASLMLFALQSQGRDELADADADGSVEHDSDDNDCDEDSDSDEDDDDYDNDELGDEDLDTSRVEMGEPIGGTDETLPKFAIVLNKVDLVKPKSMLLDVAMEIGALAQEALQYAGQTDLGQEARALDPALLDKLMPVFFYTSALREEGVDDVLQFLVERSTPSQEWAVQAGQATSLSAEERVEETIREKIYRSLHKELPYSVRQENRLLKVGQDRQGNQGVVIHQEIQVQTKSHRDLVLGNNGRTLERIRESAVHDLQKLFQCPVNLILHVKLVTSRNRDWSI
jgi:GTP-binding protein Era